MFTHCIIFLSNISSNAQMSAPTATASATIPDGRALAKVCAPWLDPWVRDCALYIWGKVRPNRHIILLIESYLSPDDAMHRELDGLDFTDASFWDRQ